MKRSFLLLLIITIIVSHNSFSQGIAVPGGTGAWGNVIYLGGGGTTPKAYGPRDYKIKTFNDLKKYGDLVGSFGFGIGNPYKNVGFQFGTNMLDVDQADKYNLGFKLHKYVGSGISIAVGVENVLIWDLHKGTFDANLETKLDTTSSLSNKNRSADAIPSYYIAMTQDLSLLYPSESALSRFSYSLGAGIGRFSKLTEYDLLYGKHTGGGTYVFGAVQVKLTNFMRFTTEWTGTNLNSGLSFYWKIWRIPFNFTMAAVDLTPYSGDGKGPRLIAAGGIVIDLRKGNESSSASKRRNMEDIIKHNEEQAQRENYKMQNDAILASNADLSQKIAILEREVAELKQKEQEHQKEKQRPNNINDIDVSEIEKNKNKNNLDTSVVDSTNLKELKDDIVHSNNRRDESFGYSIEPGNYVVVHSFMKRENAEKAVKDYKKIGIPLKIAYNRDKGMHYVYTNKYALSRKREALQKSTELRIKGFDGAWVFCKPYDSKANYMIKGVVDSVLNLSGNKIVKVSEDNDSKQPIDKGIYLIVHTIKKKDNAFRELEKFKKEGNSGFVVYNEEKEQHYIYTQKYSTSQEAQAVSDRESIKEKYPMSWVLVYQDKETKTQTDTTGVKIISLTGNDVVEVVNDVNVDNITPGYYVVLGVFGRLEGAKKTRQQIMNQNIGVNIAYNKDKKRYYVYTEMFQNADEARKKMESVKDKFKDVWIFSY